MLFHRRQHRGFDRTLCDSGSTVINCNGNETIAAGHRLEESRSVILLVYKHLVWRAIATAGSIRALCGWYPNCWSRWSLIPWSSDEIHFWLLSIVLQDPASPRREEAHPQDQTPVSPSDLRKPEAGSVGRYPALCAAELSLVLATARKRPPINAY